ncbi:MAG: hypothetical protein H0V29_11960 [Thermoleophilaceae bacterium]|nr:hypothetical protein [Thermoleophilaceae bacterium]
MEFRFDRREIAGAVADVGVLVPIAVALIVKNDLSATAVLLPAGLLYLAAAAIYRLPVPVQPLKAFGAIAIAEGLGSDEIAAGALLMGVIFVVLGRTGAIDWAARHLPKPIIRGVQLTVGLLFLKIAFELLADPPKAFADHALPVGLALVLGGGVLALALALKQRHIALVLVGAGAVAMILTTGGPDAAGPSAIEAPALSGEVLLTALTVLVLPQLPLSFANSCAATADAARTYFGDHAAPVKPGRLATSLGTANLLAGTISGMPVCHGAGGMTAHVSFGARTAGAPVFMGIVLVGLALGLGAGLAGMLVGFPLPILAGLLAGAGLLHLGLLGDLEQRFAWGVALTVGLIGFTTNLTFGLAAGLALWGLRAGAQRVRPALAN